MRKCSWGVRGLVGEPSVWGVSGAASRQSRSMRWARGLVAAAMRRGGGVLGEREGARRGVARSSGRSPAKAKDGRI